MLFVRSPTCFRKWQKSWSNK